MDKIQNVYIRGSMKFASVTEEMRSNRLLWYGHAMRRDENHGSRITSSMNGGMCKSCRR